MKDPMVKKHYHLIAVADVAIYVLVDLVKVAEVLMPKIEIEGFMAEMLLTLINEAPT